MRCLFGFICVLALGVMPMVGCSEGGGEGGSGGDGGTGGSGEYVWCVQYPPQSTEFYGVSFTDANTGTVVGRSGTILRTTDGGVTWVAQTSGTGAILYGVSFTDANTGTVVGGTTILRTTNGGATWVAQTSGTTGDLRGVSFTDANTGTAVGLGGDFGTILRTTDGGATWVAQAGGGLGVSFIDANTGTVVGGTTILRTTDGGATWAAQTSGTRNWLYGVSFTDASTGTAVGGSGAGIGTILRTTDVSGYSGSCDPFCATIAECSLTDRFPNCAESCGCTVNEGAQVSAACEAAVADVNACVVDLSSCEQVEAWSDRTPFDSYPCKAADDNVISTCY